MANKNFMLPNVSSADALRIEAAVRLRLEACEENDDEKEAKAWRRILDKIEVANKPIL